MSGVDIRSVQVDVDPVRELLSVSVVDSRGRHLPARSLSEGTLRYLALCVLLEDPTTTGVITMEEPENGIHPANLEQVVDLVRDLAVDPALPPGADNPLRQVIVNTHSPAVVSLVGEQDLLVARQIETRTDGTAVDALHLLPMADSWRAFEAPVTSSKADLLPFLVTPPGGQITLSGVA